MKFLPENYQAPKSSNNYMKLQDGENKIRILSAPVLGWEDWIDNRPVRYRMDQKPNKAHDPKKPVRHFWAFIVWNYNEEKIQILHLTQATIRNNIEALCKDEEWGEPFGYDIKITRKGEGVDTEYMVNPSPHKALDKKIKEQYEALYCNLEALFENEDPFARPSVISAEQAKELEEILFGCSEAYKKQVFNFLAKQNILRLVDLPLELYSKIRDAAILKRDENTDALLEAVI